MTFNNEKNTKFDCQKHAEEKYRRYEKNRKDLAQRNLNNAVICNLDCTSVSVWCKDGGDINYIDNNCTLLEIFFIYWLDNIYGLKKILISLLKK